MWTRYSCPVRKGRTGRNRAALHRLLRNPTDVEKSLCVFAIEEGFAGVYYKDGKFVAILGPGQYAYWLKMGKVKFFPIDMRETVLDIGGQEIMTSDKVTLRLNAILTYRVSDARKAVETVSDVGQALYRETQLALRAVVGTRELDAWLALSLVTGKAFCIENIRARRQKPGLLRQHLTAVKAATEIGQAHVEGDSIGSTRLAFVPAAVRPDSYHWAIGTAGSTTLVLQTVLPCLLTADRDTEIILEGGTHNQFAPPFEFLAQAFLPIVNRMGPVAEARLERAGFYPAGGGKFRIAIHPARKLSRVDIVERGAVLRRHATGIVAQIPRRIAETEIEILKAKLSWEPGCFDIEERKDSRGPGNILLCTIESQNITEVFSGFGEMGVPAQRVASGVVDAVREYVASEAPVGRNLADQLMIPMALAGGGTFRTLPLTRHSLTNMEVIRKFLDVEIHAVQQDRLNWIVEITEKEI
jgi:RNA 3'-terminal phosphate cyclase (ATP)